MSTGTTWSSSTGRWVTSAWWDSTPLVDELEVQTLRCCIRTLKTCTLNHITSQPYPSSVGSPPFARSSGSPPRASSSSSSVEKHPRTTRHLSDSCHPVRKIEVYLYTLIVFLVQFYFQRQTLPRFPVHRPHAPLFPAGRLALLGRNWRECVSGRVQIRWLVRNIMTSRRRCVSFVSQRSPYPRCLWPYRAALELHGTHYVIIIQGTESTSASHYIRALFMCDKMFKSLNRYG